jgi:sterol 3beta-glucosyltransferase
VQLALSAEGISMKIVITAAGSLGDVAPYSGLGVWLREAGHEITLATHESFAPLVRDSGLVFRQLPADRYADRPSPSPDAAERGAGRAGQSLMAKAATFTRELGLGMADVAGPDTGLLLLSVTTAPLGWHIAEAMGIPSLGVYLQPVAPTSEFPPAVIGVRSLGRWGNRAAGRLSVAVVDRMYGPAVKQLRARLGLPQASPAAVRRQQERARWPVMYGFSQALVPRPADWRPGLEVVGNWWPHHQADYRLPGELEDFLASGPPPVFIGFGSMSGGDGERLGEIAVQALRRARVRGVLQRGQAGLTATGDDVITIGELPHACLFPRMAAVVHHAGAGTTAAGLRAGVPAVPVPVMADQPFWARRAAALGAATSPIRFKDLSAARLADAITTVTGEKSYRTRAEAAAARIATEDGAGKVGDTIQFLAG